jgi:two-component system response regulator FixJ
MMGSGFCGGIVQETEGKLDVVVVDDDSGTQDLLATILQSRGCQVRTYGSGGEFLAVAGTLRPDCLLLDVCMPVQSGFDVLDAIGGPDFPAPILMISARGDVPVVVAAMKAGAWDYIEKPFDPETLVSRLHEAVRAFRERRKEVDRPLSGQRFPGAETLTAREMEVLEHIVAGASSKEAGRQLGISQRTVETHRAQIMEKLGARNVADLIRIVLSGHLPRAPFAD